MSALHRKLFRDLWEIRGQVLAISMVIAAGVAMFVMYQSTFRSLTLTQEAYYERYRFADVFASLKRAPLRLEGRIAQIPGVARVETRVVVHVTLDMPGVTEPLVGQLVSVPERRTAILNDIAIQKGRYIEADKPDEVLVSEGFALARGLEPGDAVTAIINGRRRELRIVGIALSPEFIYVVRPGELLPDDARFGIFWMGRRALATAFNMEGGFNDVALTLMPGASQREAVTRLDRLIEPYGGLGSLPRSLQISHWSLEQELAGLRVGGFIMPTIFLAVAAFLLNVVLTRIVAVQRTQIAALKALGYTRGEIGWHYTQWSLTIAVIGGAVGTAAGAWMGSGMISLYNNYFRFPFLDYQLSGQVVGGAVAVCFLAALVGAWSAVSGAARLQPAEAMQAEPPASYRESWIERLGLKRLFAQPTRMIFRNLQRQPGRTLSSVVGIAFAGAMLIVGLFFIDSIEELMDVQFNVIQRQDVTVTFVEPRSARAFFEARHLPGVMYAEASRNVSARLRNGHRYRHTAITGLAPGADLNRVLDADLRPVSMPPEGLVLSSKLAEILGARRGDVLTLEVLEGSRPTLRVPVVDLVEEYMGMSAYMDSSALHRLMREGGNLSGAYLRIDSAEEGELYRRLKAIPAVAGVALKSATIETFQSQMDETIGIMIFFATFFAAVIAFGVVYNSARVSLSERARELASLRVIGFTRGEISYILLGELAVVTLVAIPAGFVLGYGLSGLLCMAFDTEMYRFPLVVSTRTYAFSAIVVLLATVISGSIVRRRLDRLDLVEVLKTRE